MLNVEAVESCGFTVEYTNVSPCASLTEGQYTRQIQSETLHVRKLNLASWKVELLILGLFNDAS